MRKFADHLAARPDQTTCTYCETPPLKWASKQTSSGQAPFQHLLYPAKK